MVTDLLHPNHHRRKPMNKIILALLSALSLVLALAYPAAAYSTGWYDYDDNHNHDIDISATWIDGQYGGLIHTGVSLRTNSGCGNLEPGVKFTSKVRYSTSYNKSGDLGIYMNNWDVCNPGLGTYRNANSPSWIYVCTRVRKNNSPDYLAYWHVQVTRGQTAVLLIERGYSYSLDYCNYN